MDGCGMVSVQVKNAQLERARDMSIREKNAQLKRARDKLLKDPGDKQALSLILNMLKHDDDTVARANAATTLGGLGAGIGVSIKDTAVPALIEALEKDDMAVKDAAARALRLYGPLAKGAIPVLRRSLVPSDGSVAWHSADALGAMGPIAYEAVPDLVKVIKERQSEFLDDRPHICEFATKALGEIGPLAKEAIPELVPLLTHENPYLRIYVAVAIIRIDPANQQSLKMLESLLKDQNVDIRRNTLWTLKDSGREAGPAKYIVKASLRDRDAAVRTAASQLLYILNRH